MNSKGQQLDSFKLAELFPDQQIVSALSTLLGWSHFVERLPMADPLKRAFYTKMCRVERWSGRTLRQKEVAG